MNYAKTYDSILRLKEEFISEDKTELFPGVVYPFKGLYFSPVKNALGNLTFKNAYWGKCLEAVKNRNDYLRLIQIGSLWAPGNLPPIDLFLGSSGFHYDVVANYLKKSFFLNQHSVSRHTREVFLENGKGYLDTLFFGEFSYVYVRGFEESPIIISVELLHPLE